MPSGWPVFNAWLKACSEEMGNVLLFPCHPIKYVSLVNFVQVAPVIEVTL